MSLYGVPQSLVLLFHRSVVNFKEGTYEIR